MSEIKYKHIIAMEGNGATSCEFHFSTYSTSYGQQVLARKIKNWAEEEKPTEIVSKDFYSCKRSGGCVGAEGVHIFYKVDTPPTKAVDKEGIK
jgi:hypothetical protein